MAPKTAANIGRLGEIAQVAVKHGFGYLLDGRRAPTDERRDDPRPPPARDARRARADVRQVRPAPLDPARHRPAGHHRRAARPAGRRQAVPLRRRRAGDRRGPRSQPIERLFLEFDEDAARRRVDRAGAPGGASERPAGRRQGAAPERAAADRERHPAARAGARGSSGSASGRSTSSTRARSSTSSRARSARSSTTARRPATRRAFHRNFAGHPHVACRASTGATRASAC